MNSLATAGLQTQNTNFDIKSQFLFLQCAQESYNTKDDKHAFGITQNDKNDGTLLMQN